MKTRQRFLRSAMICAAVGMMAQNGCQGDAPPPARVAVPGASNRDGLRESDYIKPLEPEDNRLDMRVDQRLPDRKPSVPSAPQPGEAEDSSARVQKDFADAYLKVGQPRIAVFVNRTLQGEVISDTPPARGTVYLHAGQYDEDAAKHALDYVAVEKMLDDKMSCGGKVMVIPMDTMRQKLTDDQVKDLQAGRPAALASLDERLNADILIQVQAHPTRQSSGGLELQIVAQAINIRGGQPIGHAIADIDRPQEAEQLEGASRYVVRKLMIDMLRAWTAPVPPSN
jgi:hypothetical protein